MIGRKGEHAGAFVYQKSLKVAKYFREKTHKFARRNGWETEKLLVGLAGRKGPARKGTGARHRGGRNPAKPDEHRLRWGFGWSL